jgi:uncharacterized peroxidase-related enzyme
VAWIDTVADDTAEGPLRAIYKASSARAGFVAEIVKVASLNVPALRGYMNLYKAVMFGESPLSRAQREMIATVVAQVSDCHY